MPRRTCIAYMPHGNALDVRSKPDNDVWLLKDWYREA